MSTEETTKIKNTPINLIDEDILEFIKNDVSVLFLYMPNSTSSNFQEEQLLNLLENNEDKFSLGFINVLEDSKYAIANNIRSFPTTLYFKDGTLVSSESGVQNGIENSLLAIL